MSMNQNLMSDMLYEKKLKFIKDMKRLVKSSMENLIDLPYGISPETRKKWREESDINDHLFELIHEDIARLRGLDK